MKCIVCVKQVPDTSGVVAVKEDGTMDRAAMATITNHDDLAAVEAALRIKDATGCKVVVVSMGPPPAEGMLRELLAMGCDEAVLVSAREFGGSDTYATSQILAAAIKKVGVDEDDIVFCGRQAIDGDTAQVGPEISQHMGRALLTYALEAQVEGNTVKIRRESDEGYDWYAAEMPAVITVNKTSYDLRYPSLKGKMASRKAVIPTLTAAEVVVPEDKRGLKGSPTKVKKTFTPVRTKNGMRLEGLPGAEAGRKLADVLAEAKLV